MIPSNLSGAARAYVWCVVALGAAVIANSAAHLSETASPQWLMLAALTLLSGSLSIRIPSVPIIISASEALIFASALLFGPGPATLTVALDGLIVSLWSRKGNVYRTLFNVAEPAISVWVSSSLFYILVPTGPLIQHPVGIGHVFLPLLLFTSVYFALNATLIAIVVRLETRRSTVPFLKRHLLFLSLSYCGSVSVAVLLVQNARDVNFVALGLIVPLLVVSYVSAKAAMARVEDANRHLEDMNRLYISTVETLAMAIDAKDQITHGHIRRVQHLAVQLAGLLGVKDRVQVRALEAAALLHDLGKLAVPEHILNKPSALTPVELAEMKTHPNIGANILSALDFPYPVAPIVRHHHENWDGCGYPDGLIGKAIPVGARILAVVDCFDALTSDRPYRRRLSESDALEVLRSRRGTMYDPAVVDAFVDNYARFAIVPLHPGTVYAVGPPPQALHARPSAGMTSLETATAVAVRDVSVLVPETICVVSIYDTSTAFLTPIYVSDPVLDGLKDGPLRLGQRVTGWVAANRKTIVNCDPALDLDRVALSLEQPLRSCLSTPLVARDELVGVLSLYSWIPDRYTPELVERIEALAPRIAEHLREAFAARVRARDVSFGPARIGGPARMLKAGGAGGDSGQSRAG